MHKEASKLVRQIKFNIESSLRAPPHMCRQFSASTSKNPSRNKDMFDGTRAVKRAIKKYISATRRTFPFARRTDPMRYTFSR